MRRFDNVNYKQWLESATASLRDVSIESARLDANLLLAYGLNRSREHVITHEDDSISVEEARYLETLLNKRLARVPLAYITGAKEFYGREFTVTPDTLIPRPESEAIIAILQEIFSERSDEGLWLYDIGTGSGCLAVTAKLEFPSVHIVASDTSKTAIQIAQKNAARYSADLSFVLSDLFSNLTIKQPSYVIANLPYVPVDMITSDEITKEPAGALFSGNDGLEHYRKFWQQVKALDNKPAEILTESLTSQHDALISLAQIAGYKITDTKDLIQRFQPIYT